jgi:hypothetical protein
MVDNELQFREAGELSDPWLLNFLLCDAVEAYQSLGLCMNIN